MSRKRKRVSEKNNSYASKEQKFYSKLIQRNDLHDIQQKEFYLYRNLMSGYPFRATRSFETFVHFVQSQSSECTSNSNKTDSSQQNQLDRPIWAALSGDKNKPYSLDASCFPYKSAAGTKLVYWAEKEVESASYRTFSKKTSSLMKHYKKVISQHIPQELTNDERIDLCAGVGIVFPKIAIRYRQFIKAKEEGDELDGECKTKLKSVVSEYLVVKLDKRFTCRDKEADHS